MPSRRGGVATRLPIRRHSRHPFASRHGVAIATAFAYRDDGVYRAFHADVLIYVLSQTAPRPAHRESHPITRGSIGPQRCPRGIRTHNPRFKRPLL